MSKNLTFFRRNLPHYHPLQQPIFLTFRLRDSLPQKLVRRLHLEDAANKRHLLQMTEETRLLQAHATHWHASFTKRWDHHLDQAAHGPRWLARHDIAILVQKGLHHHDGNRYHTYCYCIMPNHVHWVLNYQDTKISLAQTIQDLKRWSARQANLRLDRMGAFWQAEYFDHVIRGSNLYDIVRYVLYNPVKAGLTDHWRAWPWSFVNYKWVPPEWVH